MTLIEPRPYLLSNKIQYYAWGVKGSHAFIPQLLEFTPEDNKPYAELWIGEHPKAPSDVILDKKRKPLNEFIDANPQDILGKDTSAHFSGRLPFLLKVVSIAEPLSIQTHPNKEQAIKFHAADPQNYPDANHKPEIAIALDSLSVLAGFLSPAEVIKELERYPEITGLVTDGEENAALQSNILVQFQKQGLLRFLCQQLVNRATNQPDRLAKAIERLKNRLRQISPIQLTQKESLFLDSYNSYPNDIGLIFIFLLNLVHLEKGQGMYIESGIPHAHLKGNMVECMASSDNVVRAGLTPKYKDLNALVEVLNYEGKPIFIHGSEMDKGETIYPTPAREFQVSRVNARTPHINYRTQNKAEILLIIDGKMTIEWGQIKAQYRRGQSVLIPASLEVYNMYPGQEVEFFKVTTPA